MYICILQTKETHSVEKIISSNMNVCVCHQTIDVILIVSFQQIVSCSKDLLPTLFIPIWSMFFVLAMFIDEVLLRTSGASSRSFSSLIGLDSSSLSALLSPGMNSCWRIRRCRNIPIGLIRSETSSREKRSIIWTFSHLCCWFILRKKNTLNIVTIIINKWLLTSQREINVDDDNDDDVDGEERQKSVG